MGPTAPFNMNKDIPKDILIFHQKTQHFYRNALQYFFFEGSNRGILGEVALFPFIGSIRGI